MKKIALIVSVAALFIFMTAAMVSADRNRWHGFHGEYAMSGSGNCIYSPGGFSPINTPLGDSWGAYYTVEGIWNFEPNNKGTFQGKQFGMAPYPYQYPNSTSVEFSFDFKYTVDHDGFITGNMKDGSFLGEYITGPNAGKTPARTYTVDKFSFSGWVSQDHKNITLNSGSELQTFTVFRPDLPVPDSVTLPGICTNERILILINK